MAVNQSLIAVVVGASLLVACSEREVPGAPPQPSSEVGFTSAAEEDATDPPDTKVVGDAPSSASFVDSTTTRDTAVEDVIDLKEQPLPDATSDTTAPDVLTLVDAALPGLGDAPTPGP